MLDKTCLKNLNLACQMLKTDPQNKHKALDHEHSCFKSRQAYKLQ
jgi:hypothetical protein